MCTYTHLYSKYRDTAWRTAWAVWVLTLSLKGVHRAWELMGTNSLGGSMVLLMTSDAGVKGALLGISGYDNCHWRQSLRD